MTSCLLAGEQVSYEMDSKRKEFTSKYLLPDFQTWPRDYKKCHAQLSMSYEHELFLLINVKMPTIVGILTFMSRKNSILCLSEPGKC